MATLERLLARAEADRTSAARALALTVTSQLAQVCKSGTPPAVQFLAVPALAVPIWLCQCITVRFRYVQAIAFQCVSGTFEWSETCSPCFPRYLQPWIRQTAERLESVGGWADLDVLAQQEAPAHVVDIALGEIGGTAAVLDNVLDPAWCRDLIDKHLQVTESARAHGYYSSKQVLYNRKTFNLGC